MAHNQAFLAISSWKTTCISIVEQARSTAQLMQHTNHVPECQQQALGAIQTLCIDLGYVQRLQMAHDQAIFAISSWKITCFSIAEQHTNQVSECQRNSMQLEPDFLCENA